MFENKYIARLDCHYSRIIASWYNAGGTIETSVRKSLKFFEWMKTIGLTDDERKEIWYLATNGKLEFEDSARKFISENG